MWHSAFVPFVCLPTSGIHGQKRFGKVATYRQKWWSVNVLKRRRVGNTSPRCEVETDSSKPPSNEARGVDQVVSTEASDGKPERVSADALPPSLRKGEEASMAAQAILDDVAANPEYYLNVSGVLLGLTLSVIVLSATTMALDSLPVVPDFLRMIGLVYMFWFLAKFLFSASDRQQLAREVDEFVSGVRGGEFKILSGPSRSSERTMMEGDDQSSS